MIIYSYLVHKLIQTLNIVWHKNREMIVASVAKCVHWLGIIWGSLSSVYDTINLTTTPNPNMKWQMERSIKPSTNLVPVRSFPSPSRSMCFGDVSEANGREMPRQKQNAHACVTFWNSKMTLMLWAASKQPAGDFGY